MNTKITFDLTNASDAIEALELIKILNHFDVPMGLKRFDIPYGIRKCADGTIGTIEIEIGTEY